MSQFFFQIYAPRPCDSKMDQWKYLKKLHAISKILFILESYEFLACLECISRNGFLLVIQIDIQAVWPGYSWWATNNTSIQITSFIGWNTTLTCIISASPELTNRVLIGCLLSHWLPTLENILYRFNLYMGTCRL